MGTLLAIYFIPALVLAGVCAAIALRARSRRTKSVLLAVACILCTLGALVAASDAWAFRDGFPFPGVRRQTTHGLAAAKAFLADFWLPLLLALADFALILVAERRGTESTRERRA